METPHPKDIDSINNFILGYVHIVHQEVQKITHKGCNFQDYDDLIQLGMLGLIEAAHRFDGRHPHAFAVYARIRIQGSIIDAMRKKDWIPRSVRKREQLLQETIRYLHTKNGCYPTPHDIAAQLNIPIEKYDGFRRLCLIHPLVSIDEDIHSISTEEQDIQEALITEEVLRDVFSCVETLHPQEQDIIHLYYFEEWTLREIAEKYAVSESRICQLHSKIKHKLEKKLRKHRTR